MNLTENDLTLGLFAGPGGWDEGARHIGLPGRIIGLEYDEAACATALAAGHDRYKADLSLVAVDKFGPFRGLIASPPCQPYSSAGKGLGKLDQPRILEHLAAVQRHGGWLDYSRDGWHDPKSPLILEPVRWVIQGIPEWIACEQVPAVLPFWEAFAAVLELWGYKTATGIMSAEQYGVPQTRKRAILVAKRRLAHVSINGVPSVDLEQFLQPGDVSLPAPTHQKYRRGKPVETGVLPKWVSMAEALEWGMTERPSMTVTGGGASTGGAEPFARGGRTGIERERERGAWKPRLPVASGQRHD